METKKAAVDYFRNAVAKYDVHCHVLDLSLQAKGEIYSDERKVASMADVARNASAVAREAIDGGAQAAVAIGGGTGGEIALQVMRALPFAFPKMLVTTLPFDPRYALADNAIVIVPTLADVCGINATLRQVLENAAAMLAGLCRSSTALPHVSDNPSIGITALGATAGCADGLVEALQARGQEATVFHANGFGGAAYARFARCGTFHTVIDATLHELTRIHVAGAHVDMPDRVTAAKNAGVPQILLPGGMNFIGLGEIGLVPQHFLNRPHYKHSGYFTHVQVTDEEMTRVADALVAELNGSSAATTVLVPMGGFSHQDRPQGAIEAPHLREIFLQVLSKKLDDTVVVKPIDYHINATGTVAAIMDELDALAADHPFPTGVPHVPASA